MPEGEVAMVFVECVKSVWIVHRVDGTEAHFSSQAQAYRAAELEFSYLLNDLAWPSSDVEVN